MSFYLKRKRVSCFFILFLLSFLWCGFSGGIWRGTQSNFENVEVLEVQLKFYFLCLLCGWLFVLGLVTMILFQSLLICYLLLVIMWLWFFGLSCILYFLWGSFNGIKYFNYKERVILCSLTSHLTSFLGDCRLLH